MRIKKEVPLPVEVINGIELPAGCHTVPLLEKKSKQFKQDVWDIISQPEPDAYQVKTTRLINEILHDFTERMYDIIDLVMHTPEVISPEVKPDPSITPDINYSWGVTYYPTSDDAYTLNGATIRGIPGDPIGIGRRGSKLHE